MRSALQRQHDSQFGREWPDDDTSQPVQRPRNSVHLALVQTRPVQLERVEQPSAWAPIALRASLGLFGTIFTMLSLWSIAPPPL